MIHTVKHVLYEPRLDKLKLWSLEERADLIEYFKIIRGL